MTEPSPEKPPFSTYCPAPNDGDAREAARISREIAAEMLPDMSPAGIVRVLKQRAMSIVDSVLGEDGRLAKDPVDLGRRLNNAGMYEMASMWAMMLKGLEYMLEDPARGAAAGGDDGKGGRRLLN